MTEVSNVTNTVLKTLDIGSGIDSAKLAKDLTDAVKIPQQKAIQAKIDAAEASISAYGLVKLGVNSLKASFEKLNDANELATSAGTSSDVTKMALSTVAGSALAGTYDFTISQLAQNQRVVSDQYTSETQALNSGSSFDITMAVGTTKSAVTAKYNATVTASETTTLVVGDGTNTVSVASATYNSIEDQVAAIQNGTGYNNLLFTVGLNSDGDGIAFTYKTAGSVSSTPTFTGSGSTHSITNPTVGVSVATPVTGVAAKYTATGTAAETTNLVVSDGTTTVTIASATYTTIAQQVTAIQGGTGYSNLKFTVSANDSNDGFIFQYKSTGAVSSDPTLTGSASSHTVNTSVTGVSAVNAPTTTTLNVSSDTPAGIVDAINAANTGVTATLVNTGIDSNTFRILLSGTTGSNGVFTLTSSPDLGFHDVANSLQTAQDSIINYEGISVTRETNSLTDVIQGVTLNLLGTSANPITVNINSDTSTLKVNLRSMVTTYNDVLTLFNNFTSVEDADVEMSGALSDDTSLIRFLKDKMHAAIFGVSSSPSGSITALRDIGISVDQYGQMTLDEIRYDSSVQSSYSDIVTMLTANTSSQNLYDTASKGLAQDVATILGNFTETNGVIKSRETTSISDKAETEDELVKLEARMDTIYARYLKQFGAMEGLMARLDKTKDYLTSQFETLSKAYDD